MGTSISRPVKELKGFQRVTLEPGETKSVVFHLNINQLAFYDREMQLVIEPGTVQVMVGSSSEDIHCIGEFSIVGSTVDVQSNKAYFCRTEVH
jgi:beta-glucosidase